MDFESLLKDASKEEGAGQYVLFDDYEQFLGQYHTIDEVKVSIKEHDLNWPMLVDLEVLEDRSYVFIGGRLHVI
ncbi:hypothetical protein FACS1894170_12800 [Planctomycetales bacterium]|nr:hypothetical protein FACS1894170_12800 [Planctomycetales bacterium]